MKTIKSISVAFYDSGGEIIDIMYIECYNCAGSEKISIPPNATAMSYDFSTLRNFCRDCMSNNDSCCASYGDSDSDSDSTTDGENSYASNQKEERK